MSSRVTRLVAGSLVAVGATLAMLARRSGEERPANELADHVDGSGSSDVDGRPSSAPRDARAGAQTTVDAAYEVKCSTTLDAAGLLTDWPGWRRVKGIQDACCILDSPTNLGVAVPPLNWHECAAGPAARAGAAVDCEEADAFDGTTWAPVLFDLDVSHDSRGIPKLVLVGRAIDELSSGDAEFEVYDAQTGVPLAAWRNKVAPGVSSCVAFADVDDTIGTIAASMYGPGDVLYASGTPTALLTSPEFRRLRDIPWQLAVQKHGTSTTTFAFDLAPAGVVERARIGASVAITTAGRAGPPIFFDLVDKDDVFAATGSGWTSEYVVRTDGTPVLLRSVASRHVLGFATDGDTMFWLEAFGGADAVALPSRFEVWAAPYTTDPVKLGSNARKLGDARGQGFAGGRAAAGGVYAVVTGNCAQVARASGGEVRELCAGPDTTAGGPIAMTPHELWRILRVKDGGRRTVLRRFALPKW
jgi:hypothetical protein